MPGLDPHPVPDPSSASPDSLINPVLSEENLRRLDLPSSQSPVDHPQTKDSPLTDIGTSPPPFEIPSLGERRAHSRDSYESSELSDLGDDDSEAETDKMDFLNEDSNTQLGNGGSDLQRLSELTDLANLQELDSDDSENDFPETESSPSQSTYTGSLKSNLNGDEAVGAAKRPLDTASEAFSQIVEEDKKASKAEHDALKRRKLSSAVLLNGTAEVEKADIGEVPENPETPEGAKECVVVEGSEEHKEPNNNGGDTTNVVEDIIQNGAEPVSWAPDDAAVTTITAIESQNVTKDESENSDLDKEQPESDVAENKTDAEVDEGATADVEDVVKQEQTEDEQNEENEQTIAKSLSDDAGSSSGPSVDEDVDGVDLDEQRKSAIEELISIENDFSFLRDKLYKDKLSLLEHEMQLCLDGSHPELLQIYYKVNEFYQDNIRLANATLNYSLKCINTETIATRTSIHQDFMKNLSGTRNEMITETTSSWYKINKEWNYLDLAVPDYNFTAIPSLNPPALSMPLVAGGSSAEYYQDNAMVNKKIQKQNAIIELVRRRNCFNAQLGILNGLKEFHGIPAAVANSLLDDEELPVEELLLRRASPEEIDEDLRAMGIY